MKDKDHGRAYGKYHTDAKWVHLNKPPTNEEEALQHGNALAKSGNYPVGTNGCFNVGIAGGCGLECYVYQDGECPEPEEFLECRKSEMNKDELTRHKELYQ